MSVFSLQARNKFQDVFSLQTVVPDLQRVDLRFQHGVQHDWYPGARKQEEQLLPDDALRSHQTPGLRETVVRYTTLLCR